MLDGDYDVLQKQDGDTLNKVGFGDVGGCARQLVEITELIQIHLRHPQFFKSVSVEVGCNILASDFCDFFSCFTSHKPHKG